MKRIFSVIALSMILLCASAGASAQSLSDLLNGLGGSKTESTDSKKGGVGDIISGVAGALGLGNSKAGIDQLAGTWQYTGPAVSFKSDNLLLKAGGAAAATTVEKKIEPYYNKIGLNKLVITIDTDSTFTFNVGRANLSGKVCYNETEKVYEFHFQALKKVNIGSMAAYIQLTGDKMELTFDVSKLMTLMQRISSLTNNSTLKGASTLLNQYDGMTAGFDLKRTAAAAKK